MLEDRQKVSVTSPGSLSVLGQRVVTGGGEESWHWLPGTLYWALIDTVKECHAVQAPQTMDPSLTSGPVTARKDHRLAPSCYFICFTQTGFTISVYAACTPIRRQFIIYILIRIFSKDSFVKLRLRAKIRPRLFVLISFLKSHPPHPTPRFNDSALDVPSGLNASQFSSMLGKKAETGHLAPNKN